MVNGGSALNAVLHGERRPPQPGKCPARLPVSPNDSSLRAHSPEAFRKRTSTHTYIRKLLKVIILLPLISAVFDLITSLDQQFCESRS